MGQSRAVDGGGEVRCWLMFGNVKRTETEGHFRHFHQFQVDFYTGCKQAKSNPYNSYTEGRTSLALCEI